MSHLISILSRHRFDEEEVKFLVEQGLQYDFERHRFEMKGQIGRNINFSLLVFGGDEKNISLDFEGPYPHDYDLWESYKYQDLESLKKQFSIMLNTLEQNLQKINK